MECIGIRRVIIIGSGPAGLTAGIYTARANLKPLILHGNDPGGQLMITTSVENYPGIVSTGPNIIDVIERQAKDAGVEFKYATVCKIEKMGNIELLFRVYITENSYYETERVIIATGATAKFLGLESEKRLLNKGVSTCATCDGPLYKDCEMAVIGGGDTALEEALYLTNLTSRVHLIHRRDTFRGTKVMIDKVMKNEHIIIHWDTVLCEILGNDFVEAILIKNIKTNNVSEIKLRAVFIAIGHTPQTNIFKDLLEMDTQGYIKTVNKTQTSVPGIYVCGDAQDNYYRQAITAAGSGCQAGIDVERSL